jgi:hypothetical protein
MCHDDVADVSPCSSCQEMKSINPDVPSGEYSILTTRGRKLDNVCMDARQPKDLTVYDDAYSQWVD